MLEFSVNFFFLKNKEYYIFYSILSTGKVLKTVILYETLCQKKYDFLPNSNNLFSMEEAWVKNNNFNSF